MENPLILDRQDFKVLSSDTRVSILKLLAQRRYTSSELAQQLHLSAPTIAEHVELLHQAKLVEIHDDGHKWKYYSLSRKGKKLVDANPQENILVLLTPLVIGLLGIAMLGLGLVSNPFTSISTLNAPSLDAATGTTLPLAATKMADDATVAADATSPALETATTLATPPAPPLINPFVFVILGTLFIGGSLIGIYRYRRTYFRS